MDMDREQGARIECSVQLSNCIIIAVLIGLYSLLSRCITQAVQARSLLESDPN